MSGRNKLLVLVALLGLLGVAGWWQHKPLLARYYVKQLGQANEESRADWAAKVIDLEEAALPALLAALEDADKNTCDNLEFALIGLVRAWGPEDPQSVVLLDQLASRFDSVHACAKNCLLRIPIVLLQMTPERQNLPPMVTRLAEEIFDMAAKDAALRVVTLQLAGALVKNTPSDPCLAKSRELALEGLHATDVATRVAAVQLVLRAPFRKEKDLLVCVMPLLKDSSAQVRKTALVALGPARDLLSDDDLLPFLHDPDDEVQNLCELALRRRGLQETHILMARLISDERPSARLEVFQHLRQADDIEPRTWLVRLCQDPAPAVRAAAVRAAGSQTQVDMRSCLREMAQKDTSPTVRQLAGYYLNRPRPNNEH